MVISLVVAVICLAIGLTLVLVKKDARHLLVPAFVPLALVPAVLVSGLVAHQLQLTFSLSATSGAQVMVDQLVGVARTVFAGRLCALVLLALAGLLWSRASSGRPKAWRLAGAWRVSRWCRRWRSRWRCSWAGPKSA